MEQCRADTLSHDEQPEEIDLIPLLEQCLDQAAVIAQERGVSVTREMPAALRLTTQPERLRSIVSNLLANAVEYNRAGGAVALRVQVEGEILHLSVQDTGPGIA